MADDVVVPSITTPPPDTAPAAPAAPSSTPTPTATVEVKFPDNWKQALPKEFQDEPSLKNILDVPTLAKSYLHAQKSIGADKIPIPSKHATDDDWSNVFQRLGNPKDIKDYAITVPKDSPLDKDTVEGFRTQAHAAGILPRQATKVLEWYSKTLKDQVGGLETQKKESLAKEYEGLKKEWGQAYDNNILAAQIAFKEFADPEVTEYLDKSGLGNDPKLMKLFAKIGNTLKEDQVKGATTRGNEGRLTPEDAKKSYNSIMGNKEHPYNLEGHPSHKDAVKEVAELFAQAFPGSEKK